MVRPPPPIKNPGYAYGLAAIFFGRMSFRISCSVLGNDCPYKVVTNFTQDAVTIFKDADSSPKTSSLLLLLLLVFIAGETPIS